jgi:5-methylcytosine-specific restriction protein B
MTYFRINIDAESYKKEFPGRPTQDVIDHWIGKGFAYVTPRPDSNDYRANYSRIRPGDVLFAYQSEVGIVAWGEAREAWDERPHMGEPGLYSDKAVVYRVRVDWRPVTPPIRFADIRAAGLYAVIGTFAEIPGEDVGDALRRLCDASGFTTPVPVTMEKPAPTSAAIPLNQILYGPPGTGKTYATVEAALAILDPSFLGSHGDDRSALKMRFDELAASGRVRFVTFHQSFAYEDFVEGLRAESGPDGQLRYTVQPGVFKALCEDAATPIESVTVAIPGPFRVGQRFGSGYTVRRSSPDVLELEKPNGSSLELGMGLLRTLTDLVTQGRLSISDISERLVFEKVPDTKLERFVVNGYNNILPALVAHLVDGPKPETAAAMAERPATAGAAATPKVLIIDEINRGNVARIFGELITLIEPSKRAGAAEALSTVLPYSKRSFSVPGNVHIIGTMNTADRSLASVDIALRRRFVFREMVPDLSVLRGVEVDGLDLAVLLGAMNARIEALLDREHRIGHAYFVSLKSEPSLDRLASIFRLQILPLLQEYFFEDWERVGQVLNDHRKKPEHRFVLEIDVPMSELFGDTVQAPGNSARRWEVNVPAFGRWESYAGVIGV